MTGDPTSLTPHQRERVLAILTSELADAYDRALARGISPEALAASLDARVAQLRSAGDPNAGRVVAQDVEHNDEDPLNLSGIGE